MYVAISFSHETLPQKNRCLVMISQDCRTGDTVKPCIGHFGQWLPLGSIIAPRSASFGFVAWSRRHSIESAAGLLLVGPGFRAGQQAAQPGEGLVEEAMAKNEGRLRRLHPAAGAAAAGRAKQRMLRSRTADVTRRAGDETCEIPPPLATKQADSPRLGRPHTSFCRQKRATIRGREAWMYLEAALLQEDASGRDLGSLAPKMLPFGPKNLYPVNLYPSRCTVTTCLGSEGLSSIFLRSLAMCMSTVRVKGMAL